MSFLVDKRFFFWASCSNHCLVALDLRAGVEQPFGYIIIQNSQPVQSMGRSMDCTLEDSMVNGLFFCPTLTGHRGGHTPFVQAGAVTSNTSAEGVKPDEGFSWEGHSGGWVLVSGMKVRSLVPLVIRPLRRTYDVVVRWTDEMLCGGYTWMTWFEALCVCTRWTSECWVEQMSRLHGTAHYR